MISGKSTYVRRKLCYAFLILLTILSLFPFYILLVNATRSHTQIQKGFSAFFGTSFFSNLAKLLTNPNLPVVKALFNSVFVSFMSALFSTYFSAMTATLPYSIVEAARIDGCPEFRIFNTIVVPLMKPAIAVQAIFAFVGSWNNYFIPALVINSKAKKTIPILIAQLRSADYQKFDMGQVYMIICLAIIPLVIVYLFLSRSIIRGISVGAVKE